ncbi:Uncharacterised protein [Mycobacterium tuberculosis]|nr:Uncharacterised protein [Mycobacterium tuberculosis]
MNKAQVSQLEGNVKSIKMNMTVYKGSSAVSM